MSVDWLDQYVENDNDDLNTVQDRT
jgi:hypothetical protein